MMKGIKIKTGKVGDVKLRKVPPKQIAHAGMNLAMGYIFLPFVKIKSLSKKSKEGESESVESSDSKSVFFNPTAKYKRGEY